MQLGRKSEKLGRQIEQLELKLKNLYTDEEKFELGSSTCTRRSI
jgi:hypothetical protein